MSDNENTPLALPVRLELDRRVVAQTFLVRAVAATIALIASVWLVAMHGGVWLSLGGVLAGVFAVMWLVRGLRDQRHALQAGHHVLLDARGITIGQGEAQTHLRWDHVASISVDEDRLMVNVQPTLGAALLLEPHYGGLGTHDLADLMARVFRQCRADAASATSTERG